MWLLGCNWGQARALALTVLLATAGCCLGEVSRPGGSGHALQFRDHGVLIAPFNDLGRDEFTFEAWVSTSDYCHPSALFSYAKDSQSTDPFQRVADFNHFVIFDPTQLVGCHDFHYIDLWPDPEHKSCFAAFNHSSSLPNFVERDGKWHHVAVTWTAADNGMTKIYWDGLLKIKAATGKTQPLEPGGALMLGAEQDCYGGCTDRGQGFFGTMDEVRLWRTARSQTDILRHMRDSTGLENNPDLAAYWKFNDPFDNGVMRETRVAKDSSGRGNHITLVNLPGATKQRIDKGDNGLETGVLTMRNNYAMNSSFTGMPARDITVEFWARTPHYNKSNSQDKFAEFFSYSSYVPHAGRRGQTVFLDDAILIEKYMKEFSGTRDVHWQHFSTAGSISVHINANRQGNSKLNDHWVDFAAGWTDNDWHHVAVTWEYETGATRLYFDGEEKKPFWVSKAGRVEVKDPAQGEVDRHIAARTLRTEDGSLVLGQKQECYGGCFSPQYSLHGDLANIRVWSRVLGRDEIAGNMYTNEPRNKDGLAVSYSFDPDSVFKSPDGKGRIQDKHTPQKNDLVLGADAPAWVYSRAPLALPDGKPVEQPTPGAAGHAMALHDKQVLILKDFQNFPAEELTLEFWMMSTDSCRKGSPFSYATGGYGKHDNTFLLFDYNDWGVAVMEDEGTWSDHTSGVSSTDGKWHHIAVTWRSTDGEVKLYDNGREVWSVVRGKGQRIPSGGTLVLGREQDCEGGCFDSDPGAAGDVDRDWKQEYGSQDFFGLVDEMRLWSKARNPEQIEDSMRASLNRRGMPGGSSGPGSPVDPHASDLVAYWNFDEGQGYTVKDITGRGHDLIAAETPRWEVVQWLSVCGNGVLEGLEECDDGDPDDGDGCDSSCRVEPGWHCTRTSPSRCWPADGGGGSGSDPDRPEDDPHSAPSEGGDSHGGDDSRGGRGHLHPDAAGGGGEGGGDAPAPGDGGGGEGAAGGRKRGGHAGMIVAIVLTSVMVVGLGGLVLARHTIYDHFPQVERGVASLRHKLFRQRRGGYDFVGELGLGPEDALEMSPEFTTLRPPPTRGAYTTLPETAPSKPGHDGRGLPPAGP